MPGIECRSLELEDGVVLADVASCHPELCEFALKERNLNMFTLAAQPKGAADEGKRESASVCTVIRLYFKEFAPFSEYLNQLLQLKRLQIAGLLVYDEIKLFSQERGGAKYAIDLVLKKQGQPLEHYFQNGWHVNTVGASLSVLTRVAEILSDLHGEGYSYKKLSPRTVYLTDALVKSKESVFLAPPVFMWEAEERAFLSFFLDSEKDFVKYDCLCASFLMAKLLEPSISWPKLFSLRTEEEIASLLVRLQQMPQVMSETINGIFTLQKHKILASHTLRDVFSCLAFKGPYTSFKHDSLGAYLAFHRTEHLPEQRKHMYLIRRNQIHFFNLETQKISIIKLYRRKKKFVLKTDVSYAAFDSHFYFFAHNLSNKAVKVAYMPKLSDTMVYQKSEVDFFKTLRGVQVEDPQLFCLSTAPDCNHIYVFNSKKETNHKKNEKFCASYIIKVTLNEEDDEPAAQPKPRTDQLSLADGFKLNLKRAAHNEPEQGSDTQKNEAAHPDKNSLSSENLLSSKNLAKKQVQFSDPNSQRRISVREEYHDIKIFEGPRNYQWHRAAYYFYDAHSRYAALPSRCAAFSLRCFLTAFSPPSLRLLAAPAAAGSSTRCRTTSTSSRTGSGTASTTAA